MHADGFGIRPVLREMALELAGHGYYVLVPNSFYRHGPAPLAELRRRAPCAREGRACCTPS